jgi:hypothetical protein
MFTSRLFVGKKHYDLMKNFSSDEIDEKVKQGLVERVHPDYTTPFVRSYVGYTLASTGSIPEKLDPIIEGAKENFKDIFSVDADVILFETVAK